MSRDMETFGHGGQTVAEIVAGCRFGEEATGEERSCDPLRDPGCAICRGEVCMACGGDAYDCEHDIDEQHGFWASGK